MRIELRGMPLWSVKVFRAPPYMKAVHRTDIMAMVPSQRGNPFRVRELILEGGTKSAKASVRARVHRREDGGRVLWKQGGER